MATGAALQAAAIDKRIEEILLIDVNPLPLGIKVNKDDKDDKDTFSVLIHEDVPIPTKSSEIYSTHENDQTEITVKIFNGILDTAARIGRFNLEDIPPAPKGKPRIKVTFDIDASCVLHVTAKDLDTGKSKSVKVEDSAVSA